MTRSQVGHNMGITSAHKKGIYTKRPLVLPKGALKTQGSAQDIFRVKLKGRAPYQQSFPIWYGLQFLPHCVGPGGVKTLW